MNVIPKNRHLRAGARRQQVLWIAPNLNHYKARYLDRLVGRAPFALDVLAGITPNAEGHRDLPNDYRFTYHCVKAEKQHFATRLVVYRQLLRLLHARRFDVVIMPIEKKYLPVILALLLVRRWFGYRLISYNHTSLQGSKLASFDHWLSRLLFRTYDRIVFYTEQSQELAIERGLVSSEKATFANNTVDTTDIWSRYSFHVNQQQSPKSILFIGRLVSTKRLESLFQYFDALSEQLPDIQLTIVGDGPEAQLVRERSERNMRLRWLGAVVEESSIAKEMAATHVVFVPGHSGLSIVHAFCYGKPYVTIRSSSHPPEIDYLIDRKNGLLLEGRMTADIPKLMWLLTDQSAYEKCCETAFQTAQQLSVDSWCHQMTKAIRTECVKAQPQQNAH